jgi:hypothetical protein
VEIAVMAGLLAERDVKVESGHKGKTGLTGFGLSEDSGFKYGSTAL